MSVIQGPEVGQVQRVADARHDRAEGERRRQQEIGVAQDFVRRKRGLACLDARRNDGGIAFHDTALRPALGLGSHYSARGPDPTGQGARKRASARCHNRPRKPQREAVMAATPGADGFSLTNCGPVDRALARIGLKSRERPQLFIRAFVPAIVVGSPCWRWRSCVRTTAPKRPSASSRIYRRTCDSSSSCRCL